MPEELRTCTVRVSKAVVVEVSAVSICSQKVSVAAVAVDGMVTCCITVSVVVVPKPSSHASHVPVCGGSELELLMISSGVCVEVIVQGEGFEDPFSKPPLPINSVPAVTLSAKSSTTNEVCSSKSSLPCRNIWMVCPLKEVRSKVFCWYPAAWSRLEKVASVDNTVPDVLRTCTDRVSNTVVVLVSAVSMCSQKLSVAAAVFAGMVTCCRMLSVVVAP